MPDGDRTVCAADREASIVPEYHEPSSRVSEQHSENESGGWGLVGALFSLVAIPVGWFASAIAMFNVANHLWGSDPSATATLGLSPTVSFWVSVAVLVVVGLALLAIPGTIFWGWLVMGVLTAVGALYMFGWSTIVLFFEAQTVVVVVLAMFMYMVVTADEGVVAAFALSRWLR